MTTHASSIAEPLPRLLLLLSLTTGLVDAVSVLGLGKVFTANMTGNVVFLGFAAVGTEGFRPLPYIAALLGFALGAAAAGLSGRHHVGRPMRRWLTVAAAVEAALLWIAAGIAALPGAPLGLLPIIVLTALAMGFRNATVRRMKVPDLTTTVLTLTVTGLAADARMLGGDGANLARRLGSVLAIFAGAALGAWLVTRFGLVVPLLLTGALVLGGTLACTRHPSGAAPVAA